MSLTLFSLQSVILALLGFCFGLWGHDMHDMTQDYLASIYSTLSINIALFQSIIIGVVGFWGGVFLMGSVYLLMVLAKRVFKPEEADKSPA